MGYLYDNKFNESSKMGFLDSIMRFFNPRPCRDKEMDVIEKRISELIEERKSLDSKFNRKNTCEDDLSWFSLKISSLKKTSFTKFQSIVQAKVVTMAELQESRRKEYEEHIKKLVSSIKQNFSYIEVDISNGDLYQAETCLFQTASDIIEVKNEELSDRYDQLQGKIAELREELQRKEIERQAEKERKRIEEVRRKEEQSKLEAEHREKERLEREREAHEYEEKIRREEELRRTEIERLSVQVKVKKQESNEILDYLNKKKVTCFYHFTDANNIDSIKRYGGLYSWCYCEQNGIKISNPGGDLLSRKLDTRKELQDFVRLSFCDDHPMAFRKQVEGASLVLLKIKVDVAEFKDTLFSDINAADKSANVGDDYTHLQNIDISATKLHCVRKDSPSFKKHQAECMVKTFVPIEYIINIDNLQQL